MAKQARRLEEMAERLRNARAASQDDTSPSPWLQPLQRWQAWRLAATFDDLLAQPRSAAAARFFLSDMYGEHDVSWRDRDLLRMLPTMKRWLPEAVLETVAGALEVDWLSFTLDNAVAHALAEAGARIDKPLPVSEYAKAYRAVGRQPDRDRQIDLMVAVGRDLDRIVRMPLIYAVLRMSRGPAGAAGLGQLQTFLERGFAAFRELRGAAQFLQTIESRERTAMKRLFAGDDKPFGANFPNAPPRDA
jgi:hypothetical protein